MTTGYCTVAPDVRMFTGLSKLKDVSIVTVICIFIIQAPKKKIISIFIIDSVNFCNL
tara:strand:- start:294 stop:464 length:171 start_codon:yes stop_codon:yes gene_type:complete